MNRAIIATTCLALLGATTQANALDLGNLTASPKGDAIPALSNTIDAVAGEGTAGALGGGVNPLVTLAAKQLGIPTEYLPQIQALYAAYKGTGNVTASDVTAQSGLSSWLGTQENLDAGGLASALTGIFGG